MVSYDLKYKESRLRLWKKTNQGYFAKIKQLKTKNKTNKNGVLIHHNILRYMWIIYIKQMKKIQELDLMQILCKSEIPLTEV